MLKKILITSFSLTFGELSIVGLALDLVNCPVTIVLQYYDTVGLVM